jgi:DNA-nicking Smr family endonuclease
VPPFRAGVAPAATPSTTLDPADAQLFRRVMQGVAPARGSDRAILAPVPAAAPDLLRQRREHAMGKELHIPPNVSDHYASAPTERDDTIYLKSGHGPDLLKGLRKGKWPVQASLDLHGANLDEARERLDRFIQSCREHHLKCVRIVHGKGYGSKNGDPVLKETVRRWLTQFSAVQAYMECSEADGGAGAVWVLLEKAGL